MFYLILHRTAIKLKALTFIHLLGKERDLDLGRLEKEFRSLDDVTDLAQSLFVVGNMRLHNLSSQRREMLFKWFQNLQQQGPSLEYQLRGINLLPQLLNHKLSIVKFFTLDDLALRVHGQDLLNKILIYSSSDAMEREREPTFKYLIRSSSR